MSEESTENQTLHTYTIYMIGGNSQDIKAADMEVNVAENRVYFKGIDEETSGQWTFFVSGIAAIKKHPAENGSFTQTRLPR